MGAVRKMGFTPVVRIHFVHRDIELWNEQGEAFRQWVLSNAGYCEGSGGGW